MRVCKPFLVSTRGMSAPATLAFSRMKKRLFRALLQGEIVRRASCIHATSYQDHDEIRAFGLINPVAIIPNEIDIPELSIHRKSETKNDDQVFISNRHIPALIKIDVEDYEPVVLRGAQAVLGAPELDVVLTENRSASVIEMLKNAGMVEFGYSGFEHRLVPAKEVTMANALFLRDPDFVRSRVSRANSVRVLGAMVGPAIPLRCRGLAHTVRKFSLPSSALE